MTKRVLAVLAVALCLFYLLPAAAPAKELAVPFYMQGTEVWCWSAVVRMVGEHLTGKTATDCELLSLYDKSLGGRGGCCESAEHCSRRGSSLEIKYLLANLYGIRGYHHDGAISFSRLIEEIEKDQPVIVALTKGRLGHVVAAVGYELPDKVILFDSLSGRQVVPYTELRHHVAAGEWTETFTVQQKPGAGRSAAKRGPAATPSYLRVGRL